LRRLIARVFHVLPWNQRRGQQAIFIGFDVRYKDPNLVLEASMDHIGWITCAAVIATNFLVQVFWKPYLKSYAEEKGKRLATNEDIENVLAQGRSVTRQTAAIQAEISGGLWLQQWHLGQKRDSYARLIDALENIQVQRGNIRRGDLGAKQRELDAIEEFRRARAMARLMLPPEVITGIGRLLRAIRAVDPSSSSPEDYMASKRVIEAARDKVVEIGRAELGLMRTGSETVLTEQSSMPGDGT
jgi:hypothetical protein